MAFVARFNRRPEGGYSCSYGKASNKVEAVMEQAGGVWSITAGAYAGQVTPDKKCGVVKEGWAKLAEASYGVAVDKVTPTPSPIVAPSKPGPPSLRVKSAGGGQVVVGSAPQPRPPSLKPESRLPKLDISPFPAPEMAAEGTATCPACGMPFHGWSWQVPPENAKEHKRAVPPCRCSFPNGADYAPDPLDARMFRRGPSGKFDILTEIGALDIAYHWMLRNAEYCKTDGKLDSPWKEIQEVLYRDCGYAEYRPEIWQ